MNTGKRFHSTFLQRVLPIAVIFSAGIFSSSAQENNLAIGQWRIHLPFNRLNSTAEGNGRIYCAATDGLFIYSKDDGSISRLTRLEGLSDFDIVHIRYNQDYHVLMVVYRNSNIDLIYDDNTIYNISDIYHSNIIGNKNVNHIDYDNRYAYVSCGFGIVVVDLVRREVKDTYYLGQSGNTLKIYGTVIYGSRIFAASENGIYFADINNPQLSFYSSWTKDTTLPDPNKRYNFLSLFGNKLIANNDSSANDNSLMVYDGNAWSYFNAIDHYVPVRVEYHGNRLIIVNSYSISAYDNQGLRTHYVDAGWYDNPNQRDGFVDTDNILWIADRNNGLVRTTTSGEYSTIFPNGPGSTSVYNMAARNGRLWVAGGMIEGSAYFNNYSKEGAYLFKSNQWKTFNKTTDDNLDTVDYFDFVSVAIDPADADHAFIASWGRGLFEFTDVGIQAIYAPSNSPIQGLPIPNYYQVQVGGLSFDSQNNLWIVNAAVNPPLLKRKPDGTWQTYSPPSLINTIEQTIMCDSRDRKWILLPWGGGLVVFDEVNTFSHTSDEINDTHARKFTAAAGKGKLPSLNVQSIAEDHDGQIWIGTEKGVAVLYSPDNVYSGNFDFTQVLIQQEGNYQYLLETEMVTAIAIDGANRKWFGTESSGVYLMSADGTTQVQHFTTENSPIISNKILTIAIDNKSGEVFFGTDRGIVSYKGDAIEGGEDFDSVYVYPNPVRPGYSGAIAIRGLVANANVKITDVSGNIVYETQANGGQAIWNGNNFKGERVQSGVYLVYCANEDGTKTFVTKLLFMH
ncbi:MAG TPA: two-component regulator propeller domain-containing protein [Bacteroidia bacterium]|nr:two-component regulator propeller domain-containing protein [Bacteroidia bacterium]